MYLTTQQSVEFMKSLSKPYLFIQGDKGIMSFTPPAVTEFRDALTPTEPSKQPIRAPYLGHVTGYRPIRDQCFLIRSVPDRNHRTLIRFKFVEYPNMSGNTAKLLKNCKAVLDSASLIHIPVPWGYVRGLQVGPKDGTPVLMVHGWLDNCYSFVPLLSALPPTRRYIALDLPGHGHSSHKPDRVSAHNLVLSTEYIDMFLVRQLSHRAFGPVRAYTSPKGERDFKKRSKSSFCFLGGIITSLYSATYPDKIDRSVTLDSIMPFDHRRSATEVLRKASDERLSDAYTHKVYPSAEILAQVKADSMWYQGLDPAFCQFMGERGSEVVDGGGVRQLYSPSLRYGSLMYLTTQQSVEFMKSLSKPYLFIQGDKGIMSFTPPAVTEFRDALTPTEPSKQPIRAPYLGHVTGYRPIRDQHFLIRSVPDRNHRTLIRFKFVEYPNMSGNTAKLLKNCKAVLDSASLIHIPVPWGYVRGLQVGPKDGTPVLMVHGWLDNCYSFVPLLSALPPTRRYIALDLPGHGHSSHKPDSVYNLVLNWVVDMEAIRRSLNLDHFTLIGHSLGGIITSLYSATYPDKIDRSVTMEGIMPYTDGKKSATEVLRKASDERLNDAYTHKVYPSAEILAQVGPKDGTPVLMVHGWLDNCYSFVPLLSALPPTRRYIALDLPGHGHSSHKPKSANSHVIDLITDIEHCRRGLGLQRFDLIGHSLGGMLSGIYCATYPEYIKKFVALDGLLPFHSPTDKIISNLRRSSDMICGNPVPHKVYPDLDELSHKIANTMFYRGIDPELVKFMVDRSIHLTPSGYQFTYDVRLRYPALIRMTRDVLFPLIQSWTTPILPPPLKSILLKSILLPADWVVDMEAIRRSLNLDHFTLIGHSMGGIITSLYSATYPDKIDRSVTLDSIMPFDHRRSATEVLRKASDERLSDAYTHKVYPSAEILAQVKADSMWYQGLDPAFCQFMGERGSEVVDGGGVRQLYSPSLRYGSLMYLTTQQSVEFMKSLSKPYLFIQGDKGIMSFTPPAVTEFRDALTPTEPSKQPIRAPYLGHVTGYRPIRDQHFLIRSVPDRNHRTLIRFKFVEYPNMSGNTAKLLKNCKAVLDSASLIHIPVPWGYVRGLQVGPKDGTPVLMVHGWLDNCYSFVPLLSALPPTRRYIALDLPGHGHSSHKPKSANSHVIDLITDIEHCRRGLGLQRFDLIGHSLGGMLSGIYCATYPEYIKKFVALDGLLPFHSPTDKIISNLRRSSDMICGNPVPHKVYPDLDELSHKIANTMFYRGIDPELVKFMVDRSIHLTPSGYQFTYDVRLRYPALIRMTRDVLFPLIQSWTTPILYLVATHGFKMFHHPSYEEGMTFLEEHGKNVKQLELPGPHHLHMTNTDEVSAAIIEYLNLSDKPDPAPRDFFKGLYSKANINDSAGSSTASQPKRKAPDADNFNQEFVGVLNQLADFEKSVSGNVFKAKAYKKAAHTVQSDPDLVTPDLVAPRVTKSGWPLNRGQIPLISYVGGNLSKPFPPRMSLNRGPTVGRLWEVGPAGWRFGLFIESLSISAGQIQNSRPNFPQPTLLLPALPPYSSSLSLIVPSCLRKQIGAKLDEFVATGKLKKIDKIEGDETSTAITLLTRVHGIGPVAARAFVEQGIRSLQDLVKIQDTLSHAQQVGLKYFKEFEEAIPREDITQFKDILTKAFSKLDEKLQFQICGSYRREKSHSHDVDILVSHPSVGMVAGKARRIDIRLVPHDTFWCGVLYFTGSDVFNQEMRGYAQAMGFTLNEYSVKPLGELGKPELVSRDWLSANQGPESTKMMKQGTDNIVQLEDQCLLL
eukprot:sb/3460656/